jgi:hypothetical protein
VSSVEVPLVPSVGWYQVKTNLDSNDYLFDVWWNTTDSSWRMNILEVDSTPIVQNVRIVLGCYLGRRTRHPLFRHGVFIAVDSTRSGTDATYDDLGVRVSLQYVPILDLIQRLTQSQIDQFTGATPE